MMRRHTISLKGRFRFEAGGSMDGIDICYHTSDREYRESDTVVWICHALTGNSNPEEWWPGMVGEGRLFDPEKYYIVCAGILCSPYGSSGPASIDPSTGKPYMFDFPLTSVRDMVSANILLRKHLGIGRIDMMLGPSIGGFQALEWAIMEPDVIRDAVFLATAVIVPPFLTAFNESQRMALEADPTFREAPNLDGGRAGLAAARSIALLSYRTYEGYNLTQAEPDADFLFASRACSYQQHQGRKLVDRFDAYSYWYLTWALDSMNVGRGRGGVDKAISSIRADCLFIAIDSDTLFPPEYARHCAALLRTAEYRTLGSRFGHDGFLIENEALCALLKPVLDKYGSKGQE